MTLVHEVTFIIKIILLHQTKSIIDISLQVFPYRSKKCLHCKISKATLHCSSSANGL